MDKDADPPTPDVNLIKDKVLQSSRIEIWLKLQRPFRLHDVIEITNTKFNFGTSPVCRTEFMGTNTIYSDGQSFFDGWTANVWKNIE